MSVKDKKKNDWVAQTFCDFNDAGRKSVLRNHYSLGAALRAFKGLVKITAYGNMWLKTRDGNILKDTRPYNPTKEEQITNLRLVLREVLKLMGRVDFSFSDVNHVAVVMNQSGGYEDQEGYKELITSNEHSDATLTIDGATVMCCGIRLSSVVDKYTPGVLGFVCGKMIYHPGVYRYLDGSGEPPSAEFDEEFTTKRHREAAAYLLKTFFAMELSMAVESIDEEEVAKEMQHEAKEVF